MGSSRKSSPKRDPVKASSKKKKKKKTTKKTTTKAKTASRAQVKPRKKKVQRKSSIRPHAEEEDSTMLPLRRWLTKLVPTSKKFKIGAAIVLGVLVLLPLVFAAHKFGGSLVEVGESYFFVL
jgi:Ca2+-dependent lipid-binding protein